MIAKVTRGSGFAGLQAYLLTGTDGQNPERVSWVTSRNLGSAKPEHAAAVMEATASENPRAEKPVYHLSISLAPEESLDRRALQRVVDRTLTDLGLEHHQALVVGHRDTRLEHIHVMVNRVDPVTKRVWRDSHDYARIERSLRHQERELRLREVAGRHYALQDQDRHRGVRLADGSQPFRERTGERPFGEHVREVARADLRGARSWKELHEGLSTYGLRLEKRGRGLAVTDGRQRVKASFVDRGSSLARLEARLGEWRAPGRDLPTGKSGRWQNIQGLRRAAEQLWKRHEVGREQRSQRLDRWEQIQGQRERARVENRIQAASGKLGERIQSAYRNPGDSSRAIQQHARSHGAEATARVLERGPGHFGQLRGRGGPVPSADRKTAVTSAKAAGDALRDLEAARQAIARLPEIRTPKPETAVEVVRSGNPTRESSSAADLTRTAGRVAEQIGWRLAAHVLPATHYQILKLTVSIPRKVVEASLGRERGFQR